MEAIKGVWIFSPQKCSNNNHNVIEHSFEVEILNHSNSILGKTSTSQYNGFVGTAVQTDLKCDKSVYWLPHTAFQVK